MKTRIELDVMDHTVTCDGCGACCLHMGTPPMYAVFCPPAGGVVPAWARDMEDAVHWAGVPTEVKAELQAYYDLVRSGMIADRTEDEKTPCLWYDPMTQRCRHHEHRPSICREFVMGGQSCLDARADHSIGMALGG